MSALSPLQRLAARLGRVRLLLLCDILVITACFWLLALARHQLSPIPLELYLYATPVLLIAPLIGQTLGTCQRIALSPPRELKMLSFSTTMAFTALMLLLFAAQRGDIYSRLIVLGAWPLSLCAIPVARALLRRHFCRQPWWTSPVVVLGSKGAEALQASLTKHPERGLRPIAQLDEPFDGAVPGAELERLARINPSALVVLLPELCAEELLGQRLAQLGRLFRGILLVPSFIVDNPFLWLTPRDFGNGPALLVRQNLHDRRRLRLKRNLDLTLIALASIFILPFCLLLALGIKLDSPGPVLYRQMRIGQNGQRFFIYKFRSMVNNSQEMLEQTLARDAALRQEWQATQKLKNDPRITRMGHLLRKTSLDELPQLLNVLQGKMNLVGPRPIVEDEIEKYGPAFDEYIRVKPGLTGFWQISGRSDTCYDERVHLDQYYVSNWSVWFDIWILAKTLPVVLFGKGAY